MREMHLQIILLRDFTIKKQEVKNILKNETFPNEKSEMEEGMMRAECEVFN